MSMNKQEMDKFANFVKQEILDKNPENKCPTCGADSIETAHISTCLGYFGGCDPNHHWHHMTCNNGHKFCIEHKSGNYWITACGKVLNGISNCFESYIYICKECGGDVTRKQTGLDGKTEVSSLCSFKDENGKFVKQYRTFYFCESCNGEIEVDE